MIKWEKPNGSEIETNDRKETVAYCESIGWVRAEKPKPVKRGRPKKAVDDE